MNGLDSRTDWLRQLTPRQLDVLVRVAQFKSSKQIARELDISHHTVDQRVRVILTKMGVENRSDAARLFLAMPKSESEEAQATCEDFAYQFPYLPRKAPLLHPEASSGEWNPADDGKGVYLNDAQAEYFAGGFEQTADHSWVSVLLKADRQNDLTARGRTIVIISIMFVALLVMGALVGLAEGLSRLI